MKYGELNLGQIEAIVNKLGGMESALRFLRGETLVSEPEKKWREENGIIYFSLTSDGATGEQWIIRLESKDFRVSDYAKSILCSKSFKPTNGVTYEIAVLKGEIFSDNDRITKNIRKEAKNRKLSTPNAEAACLFREKFSDKELEAMGLYWIVVMHEPIKDSDGDPLLLSAGRDGSGSWLDADCGGSGSRWVRGGGFAFVLSQVSGS
ncbi:hypothetical protein CVU82_02955 [Candidatus Falkowbacteria bacterium HGW-Falkowbacteria-1]|uniref:Uncharacterized protein n=1 Tax=Candidatus Falkowbacteria bacterium HGW-Falkowbacteria-1 TaxID=2013768 RepID=A0A2N2EA22_9BACT|nr:MAG: hypothetical protein CVU82_02955 [Candidatus Falkowbacteria bacterium HGW-Falkowbacteria-1]